MIDPTNPVVALCAEGMAAEGTPAEALRLFELAWATRRDDFDAAVAAHFLARHQPTSVDAMRWNVLAVQHAENVSDGRAAELLASLYLNLADAQLTAGDAASAAASVEQAVRHLDGLPAGGYREFVAMGVRRLAQRLDGWRVSETSGD
jgi:hypothetical protein